VGCACLITEYSRIPSPPSCCGKLAAIEAIGGRMGVGCACLLAEHGKIPSPPSCYDKLAAIEAIGGRMGVGCAHYSISCSMLSKNWRKVISKPSHSFFIDTVPGF